MSNVINFSEYLQSKNSLINKVMESQPMTEVLAGLSLELELRRAGAEKAYVYSERNNYLVVLNLGWWDFFRLKRMIRLFNRAPQEIVFLRILRAKNPNTNKIFVSRKMPSTKKIQKLLKKWHGELSE